MLIRYNFRCITAGLILVVCLSVHITSVSQQIRQRPEGSLIKINFEYPPDVQIAQPFEFVVRISKVAGYRPAGKMIFTWSEGFLPEISAVNWARFFTNQRIISVQWDQMPDERELTLRYQVVAQKLPPGIYPVVIEYHDALGVKINRVLSIYLSGGVKPERTTSISYATSPVELAIQLPDDIPVTGVFPASVIISNATGNAPSNLRLSLPPGFLPASALNEKHHFSVQDGKLDIWWDAYPGTPQVVIPLQLISRDVKPAIYPLQISFYQNGTLLVEITRHLKVKASAVEPKSTGTTPALAIDTAALFSEFDQILQQWLLQSSEQSNVSAIDPAKTETRPISPPESTVIEDIHYRVQIFASPARPGHLQGLVRQKGITQPLREEYDGQIYRYTVGNFSSEEQAREYLKVIRNKGFPDAFVVKYVNGVRQK